MQYLSYTVAYINFYKEALKFLNQTRTLCQQKLFSSCGFHQMLKIMDRALDSKLCLIALQMKHSAGIPVYVSSYTSGQSLHYL